MKNYKAIFFDLDHTLWDFEKNSREALTEIIADLNLAAHGIHHPDLFIQSYERHNKRCWEQYRIGEISKEDLRSLRFRLALKDFEIDHPQLADRIGDEYILRSPYKTHLFPGANEVLGFLARKYNLYIITNGFEEIQSIKLKESKLEHFFRDVITSERAGVKKPHPDIFKLALKTADCRPENTMMIGDDEEADVRAAIRMKMDGILFDPHKIQSSSGEFRIIHSLEELYDHL